MNPVQVAVAALAAGALAAGCASGSQDNAAQSPPRLVRLSETGPAFLGYDGDASAETTGRDWPVSLVFAGNASIAKVKRALRAIGLRRTGRTTYLGYRLRGGQLRFDSDNGLKSRCNANGTDVHVRLYAPAPADRFRDPKLGSYVVGTTHLDRADGCGVPPTVFGFSELAERRVATLLARRGRPVQPGRLALGNAEPYRRDLTQPAHIWWSDGRATLVTIR